MALRWLFLVGIRNDNNHRFSFDGILVKPGEVQTRAFATRYTLSSENVVSNET